MHADAIDKVKDEKDALDQSIALNKIVVDLLEERKKEAKRLTQLFIFTCIVFVIAFVISVYVSYTEKQDLMKQLEDTRIDFMEYLDSIEYVTTETTTTETTVTQDTGEGSGNNVYQAGTDAVYNESGGE